jgi:hypothetical protein
VAWHLFSFPLSFSASPRCCHLVFFYFYPILLIFSSSLLVHTYFIEGFSW